MHGTIDYIEDSKVTHFAYEPFDQNYGRIVFYDTSFQNKDDWRFVISHIKYESWHANANVVEYYKNGRLVQRRYSAGHQHYGCIDIFRPGEHGFSRLYDSTHSKFQSIEYITPIRQKQRPNFCCEVNTRLRAISRWQSVIRYIMRQNRHFREETARNCKASAKQRLVRKKCEESRKEKDSKQAKEHEVQAIEYSKGQQAKDGKTSELSYQDAKVVKAKRAAQKTESLARVAQFSKLKCERQERILSAELKKLEYRMKAVAIENGW